MRTSILFATVMSVLLGCATPPPVAVDERQPFVASLFTGVEQYENLNRLAKIFPSHRIAAPDNPVQFPRDETLALPMEYKFEGEIQNTTEFLAETDTVALLVIHNGTVKYENYWLTGGPTVQWMSFSVGKSFLSAMIGIAIEEGLIDSIATPITDYVPELKGSAYDNVSIKDVLQMSSGARWNEDYSDPNSDIMRYGNVWATGGSFDEFTASLEREREPGTYNYYNSTDTQALGMLMVRATGQSLASYAEEKLWAPLGMEDDGFWNTDNSGMEMAAGGLQVTARDYAKLGQLFLQDGKWLGEQIIPADWVKASVTPDAPHLMPEAHPEFPVGYGYQWWVLDGDEGEFSALGIYNQAIYVNPSRDLVIVKLSANSNYGLSNSEESYRELETFELFRAIGNTVGTLP